MILPLLQLKDWEKFKISVGKNHNIDYDVLVGYPPRGHQFGDLPVKIGDNVRLRSGAVIYAGIEIGNDVQVGHHAIIRENNLIADDVSVGTASVLEPHNTIGTGTRIHSHCTMEHATIGKNVFVGPAVRFTDDRFPKGKGKCSNWIECGGGVVVGDGVIIGAAAVILPGVTLGEGAIIAAGAVVDRDVPPFHAYIGRMQAQILPREYLYCPVHNNIPYEVDK